MLAIYAVLITTDETSPGDAATMTPEKLNILRGVFWDMNQISYDLETGEDVDSGEEETTLTITISTKNKDEIAVEYDFTTEQIGLLDELTQSEYEGLFAALAGSSTTGTMRPFGLDCSGFVDWVFYNVSNGAYIIGHGGGASMQHSWCTPITWAEALSGDLAFYPGDSHVGIICGYDESGNVQIIHCAYSANNVVVTGKNGFVTVDRPKFYNEPDKYASR